jgi:phosphate transport system substrate-binding protein
VVNPENDFATCLTVEQVVDIFKADGAESWSDVDPSFPDEEIVKYYPGADSGTFDYFTEVLEDTEEGAAHTSDGTSSEDDNVLVVGVEGDTYAIGYFGLAYYVEAGQELNAVEVDGGDGCVAPSAETAQSGEYAPYSRPLFIYTAASILEERAEVVGFINFYYETLEGIVAETGYATMAEAQKAEQWAKLDPYLP